MRDDVGCIVNMIDDAVTTCEDDFHDVMKRTRFNPLIGTLKPHSNGPLYNNAVIGTLVVDGCYIWYSGKGPGSKILLFKVSGIIVSRPISPIPSSSTFVIIIIRITWLCYCIWYGQQWRGPPSILFIVPNATPQQICPSDQRTPL